VIRITGGKAGEFAEAPDVVYTHTSFFFVGRHSYLVEPMTETSGIWRFQVLKSF
jgi:hypothetical protein